jgi:solute carrier family 25 phosphate transporter 3
MDKYGAKDGAIRDIALLFAMLPAVYQPADLLRKIDKAALTATATKESPTEFPPNYQEDFTLLLPTKYQAGYSASTKSFTIMPNINLFEIGINEDSGSPAIATTFGPLSSRPLSRERKLSLDVYALLGISGGAGCALTHTLVIPLDVVKTRLQTNPGQYVGVFDGATKIAKMEGISSLLLGAQATVVGYTWYGVSVYPCYAFFKRYIGENLLSSALSIAHSDEIALVAGAMASVVASLGLTPIEACRIRAVAQPEIYREMGLLGTLNVIASENEILGWRNLYAGLPSLMTRQVIFGSVKFLCFERASDAIFSVWPELRDATYTALGVTLLAGGISGALSSVVSQPADSVLTYVARQSAVGLSILDGAKLMVENEGIESLFRGVGSRSVWAGCIIAGQFLLYDVFRAFFGISGDNLNQVLEVVLPRNM